MFKQLKNWSKTKGSKRQNRSQLIQSSKRLLSTTPTTNSLIHSVPNAKLGKRGHHEATTSLSTFAKLQEQFKRVQGDNAMEILKKCHRKDVHIIAIGGNQLTGKSTLCNNLMIELSEIHYNKAIELGKTPFHVAFLSAGTVFRQLARLQGVEVGEFSKLANKHHDIDIGIEYESCKGIMGGINYTGKNIKSIVNLELSDEGYATALIDKAQTIDTTINNNFDDVDELDGDMLDTKKDIIPSKTHKRKPFQFLPPRYPEHTLILEGRNPAVMAAYCQSILGKQNITTIYLNCSIREQATRYISREIGRELAEELGNLLPQTEFATLHAAGEAVKQVLENIRTTSQLNQTTLLQQPQDGLYNSLHDIAHNDAKINEIITQFVKNESRDFDDRLRYRQTYDFPEQLDYTSPFLYDIIVDTSDIKPEDTLTAVLKSLPKHFVDPTDFYHQQTL